MKKLFFTHLFVLLFTSFCFSQVDCNLQRKEDKFEDKMMIHTFYNPYIECLKFIENENDTYYLRLYSRGSISVVDGKGIYILFEDGSKLIFKNEDIDVDVDENGFLYSGFVRLDLDQVKKISEIKIMDFKLYIFERHVPSDVSKRLIDEVKCLIEAK